MSFMDWSDKLSVNVKTIDNQHKMLLSIINDLFDAMKQGKGNDVLGPVLFNLITYTKMHFSTEEKFMTQYFYPDYASHKKQHDELTNTAVSLYDDFKGGRKTIAIPVMNFLKDWLINHIMGTDKKLGSFLTTKNIE